jgi:hypothetical protein
VVSDLPIVALLVPPNEKRGLTGIRLSASPRSNVYSKDNFKWNDSLQTKDSVQTKDMWSMYTLDCDTVNVKEDINRTCFFVDTRCLTRGWTESLTSLSQSQVVSTGI